LAFNASISEFICVHLWFFSVRYEQPLIGVNKAGPINVYRSPEDLKAVLR
jgi:hypothetical protein